MCSVHDTVFLSLRRITGQWEVASCTHTDMPTHLLYFPVQFTKKREISRNEVAPSRRANGDPEGYVLVLGFPAVLKGLVSPSVQVGPVRLEQAALTPNLCPQAGITYIDNLRAPFGRNTYEY